MSTFKKVMAQLDQITLDLMEGNRRLFKTLLENKSDDQLETHYHETHEDFLNEYEWMVNHLGRAAIIDNLCDEYSAEQFAKYKGDKNG